MSKHGDGDDTPERDAVSMPDAGGKQGYVAVPFPVAARTPYKVRDADFAGARHTTVDLADLNSLEPLVKRSKVARFIQEEGRYSKIPRVVRVGDEDYIENGHHRLTADYLLGMTRATVNLLGRKKGQ